MIRRIRLGMILLAAAAVVITMAMPAEAVLTRRYSFTSDGSDTQGGTAWTNNGATFSGGQVHFDGVDDYLSLPATPLPTSGSVTIEFWGTYATNTAVGSRVFDFASGSGSAFMYMTPRATPGTPENLPVAGSNTRWMWNDLAGSLTDLGPMVPGAPSNTGEEILFTLVFDSAATTTLGVGEFRLYQNGILVARDDAENASILPPLSGTTSNRLGHGTSMPYGPTIKDLPAFLTGSLNEFRVYNNVLTDLDVLTNLISGPDTTSVSFTDKTWSVAGTNDWNTGGNWAAPGVPTSGNRAIIGNGGTATVSTAVSQVGGIGLNNGAISIGSGGSLDSKYFTNMDTGDANSATINVTNGGILAVGILLPDAMLGAKTINIDGGVVRPGSKTSIAFAGGTTPETSTTTVIGPNGATFEANGSDSLTWATKLSGSGDITKIGSGTLALRPYATNLGLADQNPDFSGEIFLNEGTLDIQREHGVLGTAGSTQGGVIHMTNATLVINTGYPLGGGVRKEVPADIEVIGHNVIRNMIERVDTEIEMMGSLTGDGTLEFIKPNLADPLGIDFENRDTPVLAPIDNSGFTGRIIANGSWAVRFSGTIEDPDTIPDNGDEILHDKIDIPFGILELADPGAWAGKRGTEPNQIIEIGGIAGVAGSRFQASIAGVGGELSGFEDVTYHLGGAAEDVEFFGNVIDNAATDNVTVVKVGSNIQSLSGTNNYSGTTTINGGTLRVNGTHQQDATLLLPIGDYTVNSGGTLGGTGTIGSAGDPVNVILNGGAINPGAGVGTLTVFGNVDVGDDGILEIEIDASAGTNDTLVVNGDLDLGGLNDMLKISLVAGSLPIAGPLTLFTYTGNLTGTFNLDNADFDISYGGGAITISNITSIDSAGLAGDYNDDGRVDAGDYVRWRNALAGNGTIDNETVSLGTVDGDDYTEWKNNYGNPGSGGGGLTNAVPEPASVVLLVLGGLFWGIGRRRS